MSMHIQASFELETTVGKSEVMWKWDGEVYICYIVRCRNNQWEQLQWISRWCVVSVTVSLVRTISNHVEKWYAQQMIKGHNNNGCIYHNSHLILSSTVDNRIDWMCIIVTAWYWMCNDSVIMVDDHHTNEHQRDCGLYISFPSLLSSHYHEMPESLVKIVQDRDKKGIEWRVRWKGRHRVNCNTSSTR